MRKNLHGWQPVDDEAYEREVALRIAVKKRAWDDLEGKLKRKCNDTEDLLIETANPGEPLDQVDGPPVDVELKRLIQTRRDARQ